MKANLSAAPINGTPLDDVLNGTIAGEVINAQGGNDSVQAGAGDDTVIAGLGNDTIDAGADDDQIIAVGGDNSIDAGEGDNEVFAGSGTDTIVAGSGNDSIYGGSGAADIDAGAGRNRIFAGDMNDTIRTGDDADWIYSYAGDDSINAGNGVNRVYAGAGNDTVTTGDGRDTVEAGADNDLVSTGGENDRVLAGDGNDTVEAGSGNDIVFGDEGNDSLDGGADNDRLFGGTGNDTMRGGAGDDTMNGHSGDDTAVYSGGVDDYDISFTNSGYVVHVASNNDSVADAGSDMMLGMEALHFEGDDYTYHLDGTNNAVFARDDEVETTENAELAFDASDLLDNDSEFDGDTMSVVSVDAVSASGATVALVDGQVVYTPGNIFDDLAAGETATDTFTYTVDDGQGGTDTATVTVVVTGEDEAPTLERQVIAFDMVDSESQNLNEVTNTAPAFSSAGDGFGFYEVGVSGSIPFTLVDDSAGVYTSDSLGIIDSGSNTGSFFGVVDTINGDNSSGPVSATWSFDVEGYSDLGFSVDAGAMGDFESSDAFSLTYNIDGGDEITLFEFAADESGSFEYTLAGGSSFTLNDPLTVVGSDVVLSNVLQTLQAEIEGAGSTLNVTLTATANGGSEGFAIQNMVIDGVAERQVIAFDMVDSESQNLNEVTNTAPAFSSAGDGFGFYEVGVSGSIPFTLVDDSAGVYTSDSLGIIDSGSNTGSFFGVVDTINGDNSSGPVSATWSFDVEGYSDLGFSVDAGAMGDFESSDAFSLTYNIDGGDEITLFEFAADESGSFEYTLAGGSSFTLNDPLTVVGSDVVLSNVLQTLQAEIEGAGSTLNVTLTATANGGSEGFAIQNMVIDGVAGSGSSDGTNYAISADATDAFEGDSGTTAYTFTVTRSGDTSEAGTVDYAVSGDVDASDFGGSVPSGTVSFEAGETTATITIEVSGDTTVEDDETLTVTLSNPSEGNITTAAASSEVVDDDDVTLISEVQGSGDESDYVDQIVTVRAIVTYVTENGYFLQEEDSDSDDDAATSEGVFVYTGGTNNPAVGDEVITRGAVEEYYGQTQIAQDDVTIVSTGNPLPTAATVLLSTEAQDFESIEGMRISLDSGIDGERITVIENFNLDRYGEISVSAGTQTQPTQLFDAQTEADEIAALTEDNMNNRLIIEDGVSAQNPDEFVYIPNDTAGDNGNGYLDAGDTFGADGATLRLGAEIDGPTTGVMTYGFGEYRMLVDGQLNVDQDTNTGAREDAPADVGGDIQLASVNVLNYFTTLQGEGGSGPNNLSPRGASSAEDLARQTDALVEAMSGTGAEVFALQEIENGGFDEGSAIDALVDALNADAAGTDANFAYVDPTGGVGDGYLGTDAISTGIVYDSNAVTLVHSEYMVFEEASAAQTYALAAVLNPYVSSGDRVDDLQRNRPSVAATFEDNVTGETFTVVSNHFKSKGDSNLQDLVEAAQSYLDGGGTGITQADIDALINDPNYDQGNGQGFWNAVRTDAAAEVGDWMENTYDGTGAGAYVVMGDLNAYAEEDPVQTLDDDTGLTDLIDTYVGIENAYSYVFDGQQGALDQALASDTFADMVTGLTEWHINADEPDLLGYNSSYSNAGFYDPSAFASSDHDPLIIGLDTGHSDLIG